VEVSKDFPQVFPHELEMYETLGTGASSNVTRVLHKPSGQIYALKRIHYTDKPAALLSLVQELHALRICNHVIIVPLYSVFHAGGWVHILMSLVDGASLGDYLKVYPKLPESVIGRLCWFCLQGLLYLRKLHYLHRDLKPSNILISKTGEVKIADFGMARQLTMSIDQAQSFLGTMVYMSPERLQARAYSFNSDIWSLGLIVYECALGRFPVGDDPMRVNVFDITERMTNAHAIPVNLPAGYSSEFANFIDQCLKINPDDRAQVETLVEHPWALKYKDDSANIPLLAWVTMADEKWRARAKERERSLHKIMA
jgi:mitogen-activated protein kinase kinase 1